MAKENCDPYEQAGDVTYFGPPSYYRKEIKKQKDSGTSKIPYERKDPDVHPVRDGKAAH